MEEIGGLGDSSPFPLARTSPVDGWRIEPAPLNRAGGTSLRSLEETPAAGLVLQIRGKRRAWCLPDDRHTASLLTPWCSEACQNEADFAQIWIQCCCVRVKADCYVLPIFDLIDTYNEWTRKSPLQYPKAMEGIGDNAKSVEN
ncbi:hypothetical protein TNCV_733091 [Trichonephila clavipes]|nr:hypothetical protein TNCV_733091 [Trichonephila clavipes]